MSEGKEKIKVEVEAGQLKILSNSLFPDDQENVHQWQVNPFNDELIIVRKSGQGVKSMLEKPSAFLNVPVVHLRDVFEGLAARSWSGVVGVDAGIGLQKLFFSDGELIFASSTSIDHRLGEVIYRNGGISLEELTESAVKVTRSLKFGQVLLKGGSFSARDLWNALRLQVIQIVRSIFLANQVTVEVQEGQGPVATSVVFSEGSLQVIRDAYYFGCMFRDFAGRIKEDSSTTIRADEAYRNKMQGTFGGDLLQLISDNSKIASILTASKLEEMHTLVAIMDLVNRGICEVSPLDNLKSAETKFHQELQSKIDVFSFVSKQIQGAYKSADLEFPVSDLREFALMLNPVGFISVYLDEKGELHPESLHWMACQCAAYPERSRYFLCRIESLIQFLLQLSSDSLPKEIGLEIREQYRHISA